MGNVPFLGGAECLTLETPNFLLIDIPVFIAAWSGKFMMSLLSLVGTLW
jgi:hypothetical protein